MSDLRKSDRQKKTGYVPRLAKNIHMKPQLEPVATHAKKTTQVGMVGRCLNIQRAMLIMQDRMTEKTKKRVKA